MSNKNLSAILMAVFILSSCSPEASFETKGVEVHLEVRNVSAGFVECECSTNKDAYYLLSICEPWEDWNPVANPKQFMTLALDSAYAEYLLWRNDRLRDKEFNVAPFASHSLEYGAEAHHFFTGLLPNEDYWLFAFPVDPVKMEPIGALNLIPIKTLYESNMDIHFEYRIKGAWDYSYPVDAQGKINEYFPYITTTCDSLTLAEDSIYTHSEIAFHFVLWSMERFTNPSLADVHYGVHAVKNDGEQSAEVFQKGHTYFTCFSGYDGSFRQTTVYRFVWTGDSCEYYFRDTDSANIVHRFQ